MRIIRLPGVIKKSGLSKSTIGRREKEGLFPKRFRITANAVAWDEDEIDRHNAERAAERAAGTEAAKHELSGRAVSGARPKPIALPHNRGMPQNTPPSFPDVGEEDDERCDRVGVGSQKQEGGAS
jgi:prophage regulatory protein